MNCKLKAYKIHKASKVFTCISCGKEVGIKENYVKFKGVCDDGIVTPVKMCYDCGKPLTKGLKRGK